MVMSADAAKAAARAGSVPASYSTVVASAGAGAGEGAGGGDGTGVGGPGAGGGTGVGARSIELDVRPWLACLPFSDHFR